MCVCGWKLKCNRRHIIYLTFYPRFSKKLMSAGSRQVKGKITSALWFSGNSVKSCNKQHINKSRTNSNKIFQDSPYFWVWVSKTYKFHALDAIMSKLSTSNNNHEKLLLLQRKIRDKNQNITSGYQPGQQRWVKPKNRAEN